MQSACAVLYCVRPLWLNHILAILSHKRHDLREKITEHKMCVLIFYTILFETFRTVRITSRDIVTNVKTLSCNVPVILCQILMKLKFSRQIFEESSNIKFRQNQSVGRRVIPCRQTDRHRCGKSDSRFSQFCESAKEGMN